MVHHVLARWAENVHTVAVRCALVDAQNVHFD